MILLYALAIWIGLSLSLGAIWCAFKLLPPVILRGWP